MSLSKFIISWIFLVSLVNCIAIKQSTSHVKNHLRMQTTTEGSASGGSIFAGFILGPFLFIWSFIMIWYNQKKAAIDYRRINLANQICVEINPFSPGNMNENHNKLIHVVGDTICSETIGDRLSGVNCNNSIKIVRKVEVMEWRATTHERNGNRIVQYHLGWQSSNQPSVEGRQNDPSNWFIKGEEILAQRVNVGQYLMSDEQKKRCQKAIPIQVTEQNAQNIASSFRRNNSPTVIGQWIHFRSIVDNGVSSHGALRVSYHQCPTGPVTIMAKSNNNSFAPFSISQYQNKGQDDNYELPGICCLSNCTQQCLKPISEIDYIEEEKLSREQLINKHLDETACYTRVIRIVCFFMMVFGICLFFSPITSLIGYVPFIGGFISGALSLVIFLAAVIICIPLYLFTVAIAWLVFHPKVGLIILGVGIVILVVVLVLTKGGKGGQQVASVPAHLMQHFLTTRG